MQAWLYQMSTAKWSPENYRLEVWEGETLSWRIGSIKARENKEISKGDLIVLFFAKSGNDDPGVYGWGIILDYNKRTNKIKFEVTPPSDYLKTDPIWDVGMDNLVDRIRGGMYQGTMWSLVREEFDEFRKKIRARVSPVTR